MNKVLPFLLISYVCVNKSKESWSKFAQNIKKGFIVEKE
jgi:hypothetical protein